MQLETVSEVLLRESILNEKLIELQRSQDYSQLVSEASYALPGKVPSLELISQLKNIAERNGVIITEMLISSSSKSDDSGVSSVGVNISIIGLPENIIAFTKDTKNYAPVLSVKNLNADISEGLSEISGTIDISLSGHWAPFPESLPDPGEPLVKITSEDIEILTKLAALVRPVFTVGSPTQVTPRSNPFAF